MKLSELMESVVKKVDITSILSPDIKKIGDIFEQHGYEFRIVGGSVRDLILNKTPKDIDFATNATPSEMKKVFEEEGLHWIATGEQHGTLTVLGPETRTPYEVTTLRIDTDHTGRHATVEFTRSWEEDAERRDLTYNAMSIDLHGILYDYKGGLADLENGVTRFVGDADARIKEDYLRILRLFRFSARYGHKLDVKTVMAISRNVLGLKNISGERIWAEISKILSGPNTDQALSDMKRTGVDRVIGLPTSAIREVMIVKKFTSNPVTLIVALSRHEQDIAHYVNNWHWSNPEKQLAGFLMDRKYEEFGKDTAQNFIINGVSKEFVIELAYLKVAPTVAQDIAKWNVPVFPVTGNDLLLKGMKSGPQLGSTLRSLKAMWVASDFQLTKEELLSSLEP